MKALIIARRELAAYFVSPISYLVLGLFLLVEGYSFWLLLELLNSRSTPHGAVLQYFFGGTFVYWLFVMFLVSVITMRLVAEERRLGTLEPLLTAPIRERDVILGKYLGAVGFYAALWAPTLLYLAVLWSCAPTRPDPGPICAGYLGTLLIGSSTLAIGLFASTITRSQILAAVLSFMVLTLLLLTGALSETWMRSGALGALFSYSDLFGHMQDFARGIVDTRHLVFHASVVGLALFSATRVLAWRRGR